MIELFLIVVYVIVASITYCNIHKQSAKFDIKLLLKSMCWPFVAFSMYVRCISNSGGKDA